MKNSWIKGNKILAASHDGVLHRQFFKNALKIVFLKL